MSGASESEANFRTVADAAPVVIFRTDAHGACVYVNRRWIEFTGWSLDETLGSGWERGLHQDDRERVTTAWRSAADAARPFEMEYRIRRHDGTFCWVYGQAQAQLDVSGRLTGYVGTLTDISAFKAAQEALRHEKELTENVIRSSIDGILAYDQACRYTVWNDAMVDISGVAASETLGKCAFDVFPFLKEIGEDWYFYEALAGRYAIARDRPFTVASTGRSGFFDGHYTPVRNEAGDVVGGLAIIHDITALKETQAQLLQAGKLAAMGQLGAGVAHELNQPLTAIQMLLTSIVGRPDKLVAEYSADLELIVQQVARMGRIVDNVRGFARKGNAERGPVAALHPFRDALMLVTSQFRLAEIDLVEKFGDDLPAVQADATELQQVFLNLLTNALHVLQDHEGAKRVEVGARSMGGSVEFWVEDSGPGIAADIQDKVFDPFFTTKDPGAGTGLGLSLCHGIVEAHSGNIRIESPSQGGARFVFNIPAVSHAPAPTSAIQNRTRPETPTERILLVDDEEVLGSVIGRTIAVFGYSVDVVSDARAALDAVKREHYSLALVDLRMPRVQGTSLFGELRKLRPQLKLVAMSGFITDEDRAALKQLDVCQILAKPFASSLLEDTLAAALRR